MKNKRFKKQQPKQTTQAKQTTQITIRGPHTSLIVNRAIQHAHLMIETGCGVVQISEMTGWSKTTVHKDLTSTLPKISNRLYGKVRPIIDEHKKQNAIRARKALNK